MLQYYISQCSFNTARFCSVDRSSDRTTHQRGRSHRRGTSAGVLLCMAPVIGYNENRVMPFLDHRRPDGLLEPMERCDWAVMDITVEHPRTKRARHGHGSKRRESGRACRANRVPDRICVSVACVRKTGYAYGVLSKVKPNVNLFLYDEFFSGTPAEAH